MSRTVRTSGKAIVIHGGSLLAVKPHDADGDYYILPGGGQTAGELLPETVKREVREETGIEINVNDIAFVIEGSEGEAYHRVDIVFLCDYVGLTDAPPHPDTNQIGYEWLKIEALNRAPLYPSKLRRPIMNLFEEKQGSVYLGNECVGDEEITD